MISLERCSRTWLICVLGLLVGSQHCCDALLSSQAMQKQISRAAFSSELRMAGVPSLDKWKMLPNGSVVGTVNNHPSIDDGDVITTSPLANPDGAKGQSMVQTNSGSTYKLLSPIKPPTTAKSSPAAAVTPSTGGSSGFFGNPGGSSRSSSSSSSSPSDVNADGKVRSGERWRQAVTQYKLTKDTIGLEDEYLLAGKPVRSTSGKSNIWEAYRANDDGLPTGDGPVCVKVSTNLEAVSREYENYRKLSFLGLAQRGRFVRCTEFFPVAGYERRFQNQCALVLEMGTRDLKSFLDSRTKLEGQELLDAAVAAASCVQALHSCGLVWTDLKTENFVVMGNGDVKGIDLESAIPTGDNPVDYSPEACPPEFAAAFLAGDGPYFTLDPSYDVWSLGMMLLEMATGRGYFDGRNPAQITKLLRDEDDQILAYVQRANCDGRLKDLIKRCLQKDPRKRPKMAQVLLHPYFITSPLSLFKNFS